MLYSINFLFLYFSNFSSSSIFRDKDTFFFTLSKLYIVHYIVLWLNNFFKAALRCVTQLLIYRELEYTGSITTMVSPQMHRLLDFIYIIKFSSK